MVFPVGALKQAVEEARAAAPAPGRPGPPAVRARIPLDLAPRLVIVLVCSGAGVLGGIAGLAAQDPIRAALSVLAGVIAGVMTARIVHVAAEWERGVVLRLGRYHRTRGPGLVLTFPVVEYLELLDTRVQTIDIPWQRVITRDNIPVSINGVLYFKVVNAQAAFTRVQDFEYAVLQFAQATLRDVVGRMTLDDMLAEREQIQREIEAAVGRHVSEWGLAVDALRLLDIDMPEELKRMMSRQASAEREKRATITKAEGDKLAAVNLADAAATMLRSPGAMQLRTLQSLDGLGSSPSNTVVLAVPTSVFELVRELAERFGAGARPPDGGPAAPRP